MSNPEYVARRGILANAVAAKAHLYGAASHRALLFFLQGLSMQDGGLKAVAQELFEMFPDRVVAKIKTSDFESVFHLNPERKTELDQISYLLHYEFETPGERVVAQLRWFAEFLERVCIDPAIDLEEISTKKLSPDAPYFTDPVGSLIEFHKRRKAAILSRTAVTSIGAKIHLWLNRALSSRRISVIEGPSGTGKSHAVELWCRLHLGEARFVTLSGITHRTGLFQKIGSALGLAVCQHASSKLQAKIESHLASTKLMLVIDEAHYLFPQHKRNQSPPELIDWIDTMVNVGVPIALVCTDQFAKLKANVEKQTGWTADQFIHRTPLKETIQERPTKQDLKSVARCLLSYRWSESHGQWVFDPQNAPDPVYVDAIAAYADAHLLPLPSIRNTIDEARALATERGGKKIVVAARDVIRALESRQRSDLAIRAAFGGKPKSAPRRPDRAPVTADLEPTPEQEQIYNFSRSGGDESPIRLRSTPVPLQP